MDNRALNRWIVGGAVVAAAAGWALLRLGPGGLGGISNFFGGMFMGVAIGLALMLLLRRHLPDASDSAPPALRKRFKREMRVAMAVYAVLIVVSVLLLKRGIDSAALRACIALLPVLPVAQVLRVSIRYIRDVDELQQRIELEAIGFAAVFVALVYFACGMLQVAHVVDIPAGAAMIWVYPMLCLVYGLAKIVVSRRYR